MTNEELKKKIVGILNKNFTEEWVVTPVYTTNDGKEIELPQELCEIFNDIVVQAVIPYFADALIAAGIGDLKEHRIFAGKDGSIKQLYSGEEVEQIVKERDEYKHRAEVAERALYNCCFNSLFAPFGIQRPTVDELYDAHLKTAEKELAEENDGKKEV